MSHHIWTACKVLQNFDQKIHHIGGGPIAISLDGGVTTTTTITGGATYDISAGVAVWVKSADEINPIEWILSVEGTYDETTVID